MLLRSWFDVPMTYWLAHLPLHSDALPPHGSIHCLEIIISMAPSSLHLVLSHRDNFFFGVTFLPNPWVQLSNKNPQAVVRYLERKPIKLLLWKATTMFWWFFCQSPLKITQNFLQKHFRKGINTDLLADMRCWLQDRLWRDESIARFGKVSVIVEVS